MAIGSTRRSNGAIASSWPGSQSRMTLIVTAGVSSGPVAGVREKVLAFALSLPETFEDQPWGEDVVKLKGGKIFVFLGPATSRRMTVKLAESHAHALAIDGAEPTGYGLGKAGWVTVPMRAPGVSLTILRDWVEESYRIVAPKKLVARLDAAGPEAAQAL
jgi:predicted DNA-binding protein (MmcQ/YjbR family)